MTRQYRCDQSDKGQNGQTHALPSACACADPPPAAYFSLTIGKDRRLIARWPEFFKPCERVLEQGLVQRADF